MSRKINLKNKQTQAARIKVKMINDPREYARQILAAAYAMSND
jgi:hypothetical protein